MFPSNEYLGLSAIKGAEMGGGAVFKATAASVAGGWERALELKSRVLRSERSS